ncbi:hypothetical protein A8709_20960 [Paenibacillus pectinilyticus]|uniref:Metallo-beta-lactamase domain-containing protein n=1 Tax=Paenibacillus pectinilyticus TaxID=512399 RepID=A0A1C0ZXH6_9BACL|nr:MBL fold metallo-hydrolase [Paenibacillus pectinilyticus]OCT12812.1 hypothetical protein A8709_20960 [Paenibacillus pectinilyticus]
MIKELYPGVYVHSSHIQKMQSVILADERALYVFDPCYFTSEIEEIREYSRGLETQERERWLILTHSDWDHIAGVHDFAGYKIVVSNSWDEANESKMIDKVEMFDSEFYVDRPWIGKMRRVPIDYRVTDGDSIAGLAFFEAKGHTGDGLVSIYGDIAIVGDYLSDVEFPFIFTSSRDYERTLTKFQEMIEAFGIQTVITQHGPAAVGPAEIQRRIKVSEDYIVRARAFVEEGIRKEWSIEQIVEAGRDFPYEGSPVAMGIRHFHDGNLRLIWKELMQAEE